MAILAKHQFDATDDAGNILTDVSVEVRNEGTGTLAVLYDGRSTATANLLGNPLTFADGKVGFHVVGGAYRISLTKGGYSRTLRFVGIGRSAESDLTANNPKGAWSNAATYQAGDLVTHPSGQGQFLSLINDNINHTPDAVTPGDTAYWMYLGLMRGVSGALAGIAMRYDAATTAADPGAGKFRFNNATHASATAAYIDNTESLAGGNITAFLDSWDDSTAAIKGRLFIADRANPGVFRIFQVTGTVVDSTGFRTVTLGYVAGAGTLVDGTECTLAYSWTSNDGIDGKFSGAEIIKTNDYTVLASDVGKTIIANKAAAITFNLDAAAALGATCMVIVKNIGAGTLTIDPNGAETIDGVATLALATGQSAVISSNGSSIRSFFLGGNTPSQFQTRAEIKALATASPHSVMLLEAGREGVWDWRTGNYTAHIALDTAEGRFIKSNGSAASVGAWVRRLAEGELDNVKWYGALGNNTGNDKASIDLAFAVAKLYGDGIYFPKGIYAVDVGASLWTWDFSGVQYGFRIEGAGLAVTEVRISNVPTGAGEHAWLWSHQGGGPLTPGYDKVIKGLTIRSSHNGPTLVLGKNDLSDSFETAHFERFSVINGKVTAGVQEALRLNFVLGSQFNTVRIGCYANGSGTNYGVALRLRQACFNTFLNTDFGNGQYGIQLTDFGSYGNVFIGGGSENVTAHISIETALATKNTWIGGRYSLWTAFAFRGTAGADNVIKNPMLNNGAGPTVILDPANSNGIRIEDRAAVNTPAAPASGATVTNTTGRDVEVTYWGLTTLTSISLDGAGDGRTSTSGTFILCAGKSVALNYTGTLTWRWRNIS